MGRKPGEKAQCDLSRLAKLHSNVLSPVPSAANMGQCLAQTQLVSPGALGTHSHLGSSPVWTARAPRDPDGFEQEKKSPAKPPVTTTGGPGVPSPGVLWQLLTPNLLGGVGRASLPSPAMALCDTDHQPVLPNLAVAVLPRAHGVTSAIGDHPSLIPLCLECCKTSSWRLPWDVTELGSPGLAQPCSFSPFTLSQGPESWAGPANTSRRAFSGATQHSCVWLLSPQWMG